MAKPAESVAELLAQLARARGTREKVRVVGRAWSLLRSLSPEERQRVAFRFGSDRLWHRIEKSLLQYDLGPGEELLRSTFERMRDAGPEELRVLATMVRERDRAGLRDAALGMLSEALQEEAEDLADDVELEIEELEAGDALGPEEGEAEPVPRAPVPAKAPEPEPPQEPMAVAPVPAPAAPPAPRAETAPRPEPSPAFEVPPPPVPSVEDVAPAPEPDFRLTQGAGSSAVERLRALRALHSDVARAGGTPDDRERFLEWLGCGWAARRALSELIRRRALGSLDEALALTAKLDTATRQAWCLADLLAAWPLDPAEVERVLAAAPTDTARRRLARRWRVSEARDRMSA